MIAHPDIPVVALGWAFASGIRAEADLAALARSRHAEADLAESRARGAALLARMRAVFEDVATRLPSRTPWVAAQLATCEAEFSRLEGTPDPDLWASGRSCLGGAPDRLCPGYALMREAEATLARARRPAEGRSRPERGPPHCERPRRHAPPPEDRGARGPGRDRPRAGGAVETGPDGGEAGLANEGACDPWPRGRAAGPVRAVTGTT